MRNAGTATMAGEFPDADIEKQQSDVAAEDDSGVRENVALGQSQDLVEKVIDVVVVVDCANKGELQPERDPNSHEECRIFADGIPHSQLLKICKSAYQLVGGRIYK